MKKTDKAPLLKGFKAYSVAGHIVWAIMTPLLIFIGGGSWLIRKLDWDYRLIMVFVVLGIVFMVTGVWSYVKQLLSMFDDLKDGKARKFDKRDYDYYDNSNQTERKSAETEEKSVKSEKKE